MDSPSSGSTCPPAPVEDQAATGDACHSAARPDVAIRGDLVVVAGFRDAIAADFAAFVGEGSRSEAVLVADERIRAIAGGIRSLSLEAWSGSTPEDWRGHEPASLILFLPPRLSESDRRRLADLIKATSRWPIRFVGIVGTFRVHLDDPAAEEAERFAISLVRSSGIDSRVAVFRPGYVLSPNSGASRWLRRLAPLFPLAPSHLRTCFIEGAEFFAAIEAERSAGDRSAGTGDGDPVADRTVSPSPVGRSVGRRERAYTLLGANLPWRDVAGATPGPVPAARGDGGRGSLLLAPPGTVDRGRRHAPGEAGLVGEAVVGPHAEAAFDARIAVPLPPDATSIA